MTTYIRLKNQEENIKLYKYLEQNNYKELTLSLLEYINYVAAVDTDSKTYFASWNNPNLLDTLSKDYKVVTLQQFILKQEGRILL